MGARRYICSGGCGRTRTISHNHLPLAEQRRRELPPTAGFCIYCPEGVYKPEEPTYAEHKAFIMEKITRAEERARGIGG